MQRFNLEMLAEAEGKEKHRFEVPKRFAALEESRLRLKLIVLWKQLEYQNFSERECRLL
jgi:hypothetical protein